ncbi:hypothetical protein HK104_010523 [Borealophlyctis nickersoniae]|nr:hypothetical protein HK104_010523 [Borealophlyctis nickersoniae]
MFDRSTPKKIITYGRRPARRSPYASPSASFQFSSPSPDRPTATQDKSAKNASLPTVPFAFTIATEAEDDESGDADDTLDETMDPVEPLVQLPSSSLKRRRTERDSAPSLVRCISEPVLHTGGTLGRAAKQRRIDVEKVVVSESEGVGLKKKGRRWVKPKRTDSGEVITVESKEGPATRRRKLLAVESEGVSRDGTPFSGERMEIDPFEYNPTEMPSQYANILRELKSRSGSALTVGTIPGSTSVSDVGSDGVDGTSLEEREPARRSPRLPRSSVKQAASQAPGRGSFSPGRRSNTVSVEIVSKSPSPSPRVSRSSVKPAAAQSPVRGKVARMRSFDGALSPKKYDVSVDVSVEIPSKSTSLIRKLSSMSQEDEGLGPSLEMGSDIDVEDGPPIPASPTERKSASQTAKPSDMDVEDGPPIPASPTERKSASQSAKPHVKTALDDLDALFVAQSSAETAVNLSLESDAGMGRGAGSDDDTFRARIKTTSRVARMRNAGSNQTVSPPKRSVSFEFQRESEKAIGVGTAGVATVSLFSPSKVLSPPFSKVAPTGVQSVGSSQAPPIASPPAGSGESEKPISYSRSSVTRTYGARSLNREDLQGTPISPPKKSISLDSAESMLMGATPVKPAPPPVAASPLVRHPIGMTYGRSRSFLSEVEDPYAPSPYMSESQRRRDEGLESSDEDEPGRKEVKTVHELREAGMAKRFSDEMAYLLDGLQEDQSIGVKRSSCLELAKKILSGKFMMKVRAHDFVPRVYAALHAQEDPFLLATSTFAFCVMLEDKRNIECIAGEPDCIDVLVRAMNLAADPLSGKWAKTKYEKRLVSDLQQHMTSSGIFVDVPSTSLSSIALRCLAAVTTSQTPRNIADLRERLLSSGSLPLVAGVLQAQQDAPVPTFDHKTAEQCLQILEFATLACVRNQMALLSVDKFLEGLVNVMIFSQDVARTHPGSAVVATETYLACLRVLINLTNDHEECSGTVGCTPYLDAILHGAILPNPHLNLESAEHSADGGKEADEAVGVSQDESDAASPSIVRVSGFDVFLMSIGLLINLVEVRAENRDRIRDVELSRNCSATGPCFTVCTCPDRESSLVCLVDIFAQRLEAESQETESNVGSAYMAVLLGCLMKQNVRNRDIIRSRMPEKNFKPAIQLLEEFVKFHGAVVVKASGATADDGSEDGDAATGVGRLGGVMDATHSFADVLEVMRKAEEEGLE